VLTDVAERRGRIASAWPLHNPPSAQSSSEPNLMVLHYILADRLTLAVLARLVARSGGLYS
jgi:hypothetical protein